MIEVEHRDDVRVVHWEDGDNRFNVSSVARWHEVLDELDQVTGPLAVVVTGTGKYFSNGLDLDRFAEAPEEVQPTADGMVRLFGRLLVFPAYTVAAINGHAFAGAPCSPPRSTRRVMRADRGYWCLPEVDLGLPLSEAMTAVLTTSMPRRSVATAMLTGRRYTAEAAEAAGLVDLVADEPDLVDRAVAMAAEVAGKHREVLRIHKRELHGAAAERCGWTG